MLKLIAGIILVVWLAGLLFDLAGNIIHVLLIVGLIIFIYDLVIGSRKV